MPIWRFFFFFFFSYTLAPSSLKSWVHPCAQLFVTSWMISTIIHYFLDDGSGGKKKLGPLDFEDWDNVKVFVKFLKLFFEVTLRFSSSLYITSKVFFHELCLMKTELTN